MLEPQEAFNAHYDLNWTVDKDGNLSDRSLSEWMSFIPVSKKKKYMEIWKKSIARGKPFTFRVELRDRDGNTHWYILQGAPQFSSTQELISWTGSIVNIDEETDQISEILKKEHQQMMAIKSARIGHWEFDLKSQRMNYINDPSGIYGRSVMYLDTLEKFMKCIHPEDQVKVLNAMNESKKLGAIYEIEFRLIWPDGSTHWLLGRGQTHLDEKTHQLKLIGINLDISERKKTEVRLKEIELQLAATFNQAAVGIAHVGTDGKLIRVNAKFAQITGYSQEELAQLSFQDITHPNDLKIDLDLVRQVIDNKINTYTLEKRYIKKDKSIVWINLTVALVRHLDGKPHFFISVIQDISDMKEDQQAIRELTNELEIRVKERTQELENINSELEQFLFMVSHNLREPIQNLRSSLEVLKNKIHKLLNTKTEKYMQDIILSSSKLNHTVQNLLGFSRVKRGEMPFSHFDLSEAVKIGLSPFEPMVKDQLLQVITDDLEDVFGSKILLSQFFNNIFEYFLGKYQKDEHKLVIEIGHEYLHGERIFYIKNNFGNLNLDFNTQSEENLDLGMVLCKSIIEKHNGKIWCQLNLIYFTLPKSPIWGG